MKTELTGKLILQYLPADYADCFAKKIEGRTDMNVDQLFDNIFCHFPLPVRMMLKLRDAIVKPFGLKVGTSFRDRITVRNEEEIIIGADDKHLNFLVSVYCSVPGKETQTAAVSTVVKFNNFFGKIYFACVWLFHKLIVSSLFNNALKMQK